MIFEIEYTIKSREKNLETNKHKTAKMNFIQKIQIIKMRKFAIENFKTKKQISNTNNKQTEQQRQPKRISQINKVSTMFFCLIRV